MSASFTVTIGKQGVYSAKITVDNGDTSKLTKYDSLCPSYRYIQNFEPIPDFMEGPYDYKITIIRNRKYNGSLILFNPQNQYYLGHDTLTCDSLGFQPGSQSYSLISDTIVSDTSIYYWNYPRLVKKTAAPSSPKEIYGFANHLKLLLRTSTFSDSLIITRGLKYVHLNQKNNHSAENQLLIPHLLKPDNAVSVYNLKGIKLHDFKTNSILIIQDKKRICKYIRYN